MWALVLRTAVILIVHLPALFSRLVVFQSVTVIRCAISLMIAVSILLKPVHVSKGSHV